jgi:hypothetical protein
MYTGKYRKTSANINFKKYTHKQKEKQKHKRMVELKNSLRYKQTNQQTYYLFKIEKNRDYFEFIRS